MKNGMYSECVVKNGMYSECVVKNGMYSECVVKNGMYSECVVSNPLLLNFLDPALVYCACKNWDSKIICIILQHEYSMFQEIPMRHIFVSG